MARASHREKLLHEGLRVVHRQGFGGASVRDIVQAAGVPQGSFTNHFRSKEAFGLEVLELYYTKVQEAVADTLRNDALPPLQRLRAWIDFNIGFGWQYEMRDGCILGNFSAEAGDGIENIRVRLAGILDELQQSVAYCLKAAVRAGELPRGFETADVAGFIVSSLQGAFLIAKAQRDAVPLERFRTILFATILR